MTPMPLLAADISAVVWLPRAAYTVNIWPGTAWWTKGDPHPSLCHHHLSRHAAPDDGDHPNRGGIGDVEGRREFLHSALALDFCGREGPSLDKRALQHSLGAGAGQVPNLRQHVQSPDA